jgi:hypothetical protein
MKNPTFSRVKIYCHSKVNYPDIFFKVFHNIEKKITAVISKLPWNLITAVNCLITQAPGPNVIKQITAVIYCHSEVKP